MAWLYQRPDSGRWWVGFRHNGQQVLKSTGQTDKVEAQKEMAKVEMMLAAQRAGALTREVYQALTGQTLRALTLKAALAEWMDEARVTTGERTIEKYQTFADSLVKHFHATDKGPLVSDVTRNQLQEFLNAKRVNVSAGTTNMARKCMAIFFKRCRAKDITREDPVAGIKFFKPSREDERIRRPFTLTELSELYKQAPNDFWRYMVVAGFFTGLRLGDLVTMPIGAFDFKARTINVVTRKTGEQMRIPIAPPLYRLLAELGRQRKGATPTDLFWPKYAERYERTGSGWFSQRFYDLILVKAGVAKVRPHRGTGKTKDRRRHVNEVSFHCLRHSYVSTLAALGQSQQIVKALSGHSSDEINDLYTKLPAEVLKPAIALLPDITKAKVTK
jgi:integrase